MTPKAGLTPRAPFSNLIFEDAHETCANDEELPLSSPLPRLFHPGLNLDLFNDSNSDFIVTEDLYDRKPILDDSMPCRGQPVEWTPGSVWDSIQVDAFGF